VLLEALIGTCSPQTRLCVAADLTLESEAVKTQTIAEWRRAKAAIGRRPAVFLLQATT
jgi:16S rRNA (cytidine1402-2'-O)-methyltransferase